MDKYCLNFQQSNNIIAIIVGIFLCATAVNSSCPKDWWSFRGEKCITYVGFDFPYEEAIYYCRGRNPDAKLISIQSEEEEQFLVSLARRQLNEKYVQWIWLGANKTGDNSNFNQWVDKSSMRYTNWYEGLGYQCPDVEPGRDCVAMGIFAEKDGSVWCNFNCQQKFHWFCQIEVSKREYVGTEVSTLGNGDRLPFRINYDLHDIGDMHLTFIPEPVSGEEAPLLCPFGEMITIRNDEQEDELIDFLKNNISLTQPVLIGIKRNGTGSDESNFVWTDNSEMNYTNWAPYEPNFAGRSEYCVVLDLDAKAWRDVSCKEKFHLLCDQYVEEDEMGIGAWLYHQYFERSHLSTAIWLLSITVLVLLFIICICAYLSCREKVSRVALEFNHETKAYTDVRQTDCECFSTNVYDTT